MRLSMAAIGMIALVGCVSEGTQLPSEIVDSSYTKHTLTWSGSFAGLTTSYYMKSFEKDGKLALCAVRETGDGTAEDLADEWFTQARVVIGSEKNTIISGRLMALYQVPLSETHVGDS